MAVWRLRRFSSDFLTGNAMLKSLTSQFALTLFLGPLGLVYSSVAAAVFLTLVFAVLYFTAMGPFAVLLMWPVAIVTGLVFVKMHNDRIRQSGGRLLLGPGEEGELVSTLGSWGRGFAVLSLLAVGGYLGYWYLSGADQSRSPKELLADSLLGEKMQESTMVSDLESDALPMATIDTSNSGNSTPSNLSNVIAFEPDDATPVVIGTSSGRTTSSAPVSTNTESFSQIDGARLYVEAQRANLRNGPGTNYSILDQVESGDELVELERAGSWISVAVSNSGVRGWIFNGLVTPR